MAEQTTASELEERCADAFESGRTLVPGCEEDCDAIWRVDRTCVARCLPPSSEDASPRHRRYSRQRPPAPRSDVGPMQP